MLRFVRIAMLAATMALAGCSALWLELGVGGDPEAVREEAWTGDGAAAFRAYQLATSFEDQRKWICIAANRDYPPAQAEIARLHWHGFWEPDSPFGHDAFRAYVWSLIASQRHEPMEEEGRRLGTIVPSGERWRAEMLASVWVPDPEKCEDMESSEYYNIPSAWEFAATRAEVLAAAEAGNARAAFLAYRMAETDDERRRWLCIAANRDYSVAQTEIAELHRTSSKAQPGLFAHDDFKAYVWSVIAVHRYMPFDEMEEQIGGPVAGIERWRAMAQAVSWRPDPAKCDNMEGSAYFALP